VAKEKLPILVCVCILRIISCFIYHFSYKKYVVFADWLY